MQNNNTAEDHKGELLLETKCYHRTTEYEEPVLRQKTDNEKYQEPDDDAKPDDAGSRDTKPDDIATPDDADSKGDAWVQCHAAMMVVCRAVMLESKAAAT